MAKPILNQITTFDAATTNKTVAYIYSGTVPCTSTLYIYYADTMAQACSPISTTALSYVLKNNIPKGTLVNGKKYYAQLTCKDKYGTVSAISDKTYFWCLATPSLTFNDITSGQTISSSSLYVSCSFTSQQAADGSYQSLSEYQFYLYDANKYLISKSDTEYKSIIEHTYRGLENQTNYFIRCTGVTDRGLAVDSGYLGISVNYTNPSIYSTIYTTVDNKNGIVNYSTNYKIVEPTVDDPSAYTIQDSKVLLVNNKSLTYDTDFIIDGDFTVGIKFDHFGDEILVLKNGDTTVKLIRIYTNSDSTKFRFKLIVPNVINNYILYSDEFDVNSADEYVVYVRRINNVYGLYAYLSEASVSKTDYWYGKTLPGGADVKSDNVYVDLNQTLVKIDEDDFELFIQNDEPSNTKHYAIWLATDDVPEDDEIDTNSDDGETEEGGTE